MKAHRFVMAVLSLSAFGLVGARERVPRLGGTLEIDRRPTGGTRIRAEIPVANS